jgi:predicted Holliday junction resolvase-like endonuclease
MTEAIYKMFNGNFITIVLIICILVLLCLALWLITNSTKLNNLTKSKLMDEDWVDKQLYNLDAEQINSLLKYKEKNQKSSIIKNDNTES